MLISEVQVCDLWAISVCRYFKLTKSIVQWNRFYPIFSSSENFGIQLPPHLRCMKFQKKIRRIYYFFAMQWYVRDAQIRKQSTIVANGTTYHCKLKQGSKIVLFNSNNLIGCTKVSCIFMRNEELHYLLNSRRTNSLNISLFVVFTILIMHYVAWQW